MLHQKAGGVGIFEDPITAAVAAPGGRWEHKPGTRFYVPLVRRYFVVEDFGSGRGVPAAADTWLDLWIDGRDAGEPATIRCMTSLTGIHRIIIDPEPDHLVAPGSGVLNERGCPLFED